MGLKGFTLMELVVVVIIIGVLATVAIPSYQLHMIKVRDMEGVHALTVLREAQERYKVENSVYAGSLAVLDVDIAASDSFGVPTVSVGPDHLADITNNRDNYTIWIESGSFRINCVALAGAIADVCGKIGHPSF